MRATMSESLVIAILRSAMQLAIGLLGKDRTQSILDAEYASADAIADEAEGTKLGDR